MIKAITDCTHYIIMFIYYSHIDKAKMFMSYKLPKYYSLKHDTLEPLNNNNDKKTSTVTDS